MQSRQIVLGAACATFALVLAGCSAPLTEREKTALGGAAIGAGSGAIIGAATGHTAQGAAIGGGIGALGGALVGNQIEGQRQRDIERQREIDAQDLEIRRQREELEELKRRDRYDDY